MFTAFASSILHHHRAVLALKRASPVAAVGCVWWIRREQAAVVAAASSRAYSLSSTTAAWSKHYYPMESVTASRYATMWRSRSIVRQSHSSKRQNMRTAAVRQQHQPTRGISSDPKTPGTTTTPTPPPPTSSSTKRGGFLQWYEGHLQRRPVVTKMMTGSFLWGVGDAVAQLVPQMMTTLSTTSTATPDKNDDTQTTTTSTKAFVYDWPRTGRAAFFGFAIHAPTSHVHFNFLEWLTHRVGVTGLAIPFFKAFMEQFVYWSWLSNSLYHGAMGAMQGMTPQQIYDRIADVLWETQKAQWIFWIPVQLLNFQYVPVRHQLNVVLLTSIAWTALLSMWYPPTVEEEEETKAEQKEHMLTTSMSTELAVAGVSSPKE